MSKVNCNVIQDLLPGYNDKITSKESNELIEEHLKTCETCKNVLKEMNKEIDIQELAKEEVDDYLKGYKKSIAKTIIFVIALIMTIVIFAYFLLEFLFPNFYSEVEGYVDVNDINVEFMYKDKDSFGEEYLAIYFYSNKFGALNCDEHDVYLTKGREKDIVITTRQAIEPRFKKKFEDAIFVGDYAYVYLEDDVEKINIRDKNGKLKEIWNKDMEVMTKEEWAKWYIEKYAPKEIIEKYNINYDDLLKHNDNTYRWRYKY